MGRRLCRVSTNEPSGSYRLFTLIDPDGPAPLPGQFYMLATERHWEERDQRPYLPRALSVADADGAAGSAASAFLPKIASLILPKMLIFSLPLRCAAIPTGASRGATGWTYAFVNDSEMNDSSWLPDGAMLAPIGMAGSRAEVGDLA